MKILLTISIVLLAIGCSGSSVDNTDLPIVQETIEDDDDIGQKIIWEGSGSKRTDVFSDSKNHISFNWSYATPGIGFYEFSLQLFNAETNTPVNFKPFGDTTKWRGGGKAERAGPGSFYFVVKSNGDWSIDTIVFK